MKQVELCVLVAAVFLLMGVPVVAIVCEERPPVASKYINSLVSSGVTMLEAPDYTRKHCKGEWSLYGSKCNVADLEKHAEKDLKDIGASTKRLKDTVLNIAKKLSVLLIPSTLFHHYHHHHHHHHPGMFISHHLLHRRDIKRVRSLIRRFKEYSVAMDNCWVDTYQRMRSASLCFTCSSRAAMFFRDNQKVVVSQNACQYLVRSCARPLHDTLDVLGLMYKVIKRWKGGSANTKLNSYMKQLQLTNLISDLSTFIYTQDGTSKQLNSACMTIAQMSTTPFVVTLDQIAHELHEWVSHVMDSHKHDDECPVITTHAFNAPQKSTTTNSDSLLGRRLSETNPFGSDINIEDSYLAQQISSTTVSPVLLCVSDCKIDPFTSSDVAFP